MKQIKKVIAHSLVAVLCLSSFLTNTASTEAKAKKPKLSQKSITLTKGKSKTLKVKNTKKCKVTWKTSKKKVVSISKKKRTSCKLKAKAKGTAKITCTDNTVIYPGEAGAKGRDVYATLVFGENAYGTTELADGGLALIVKQLGSAGTADPLNQRATVGWKANKVTVRLVEAFMVRIETASTFNAED